MNRYLTRVTLAIAFAFGALVVTAEEKKKDDPKAVKPGDDKKKPAPKDDDKKKKKGDDDKKGDEEKPKKDEPKSVEKLPDFSNYVSGGDINGEVFKADDSSITIRVTQPPSRSNSYREKHIDTVYKYAEGALARRKDPPPFFDDKGLKRQAKPEELEKLRKPMGAPHYMMERTDIKPGDIVTLKMARPRTIPASKAKPDDYEIKYAIVIGEKPPPKDDKKK
jgi:hypothetical protein